MQPTKILDKYLPGTLAMALSASAIWGAIEGHIVNAWTADWQGEIASIGFALCAGVMAGMWLVRRFEAPGGGGGNSEEVVRLLARCHEYETRVSELDKQSTTKNMRIALLESELANVKRELHSHHEKEDDKAKAARSQALILDVCDKLLLIELDHYSYMDIEMNWSELSDQLEILDECVEFTEIGDSVYRVWITDYGRYLLNTSEEVFAAAEQAEYEIDEPWWFGANFIEVENQTK